MKQEHTLNLPGGDQITVQATSADVRVSFVDGEPCSGCPSMYSSNVPVEAALRFARGIQRTARMLTAKGLSFGEAVEVCKAGGRVTRPSWNGKGMYVELQRPDAHSKMLRPYLYMSHADGVLGPWNATQSDMLAEDWEVVK